MLSMHFFSSLVSYSKQLTVIRVGEKCPVGIEVCHLDVGVTCCRGQAQGGGEMPRL